MTINYCVNTHTLYLLKRSGAWGILLYRLGLSCVNGFIIIFIRRTTIHKIKLNTACYKYKHAFRKKSFFFFFFFFFFNIITCVIPHIYSGVAEPPEVFLLSRLGLNCVKDFKLSLLGEPLFIKKNCGLHIISINMHSKLIISIEYNIVYR